MIEFNAPYLTGNESKYIDDVLKNKRFQGNGPYTRKSITTIQKELNSDIIYLTPSGTSALEFAALLSNLNKGDEVIMPSFTFSSTANAFVLRGCKIKFIDIRPDTLNIDENLIEEAITDKTKVIVPVHYAGVSAEMDKIMEIAKKYNLMVVEDAAQGYLSKYKDRNLGTIGDVGCFSFHETKNIQCGEGGAIIINNKNLKESADEIQEKGTNRTKFLNGDVDKYTWVNIGSSYLMPEINAAFLYAQLNQGKEIIAKRLSIWDGYYNGLKNIEGLQLPFIPKYCQHNAHIFYLRLKDLESRNKLMSYLYKNGIKTTTHYVPLHSSPYGKNVGEFVGEDKYTTSVYNTLLRLPLYPDLPEAKVNYIGSKIVDFFQ